MQQLGETGMSKSYKAISIGLNKRILVESDKVNETLSDLYKEDYNKDYYVSIFNYDEKAKDLFDKTKSLSGFTDLKTSQLVFDFDSKSDISGAKKDAQVVVDRLIQNNIPENKIQITYSGSKGFHVQVNLDKEYTKNEIDFFSEKLSKDLPTSDTSIRDCQRIIRAPLSKHLKSGLFKVPLTKIELINLSTDEIKKIATDPDDSRWDMLNSWSSTKPASLDIAIPNDSKEKITPVFDDSRSLDFNRNKTGLTNAKYALAEGYFEEGERHEAVMILAATYLGLGWHKELAYNNIKATLRLRARRLGLDDVSEETKQEVWKEVESVFGPSWKGGMFAEDKNELLIRTKKRYNIEDKYDKNLLIRLSQVNSIFSDFATNIDKNTLKLGIPSFDQEIRVTTSTLVSILAAPSAGKSSISFGILNSTSKQNIKSMFFSLDMAAPQVYQRLAQRHTGYHSDRLFHAYQNKDMAVIEKVESTLDAEYSNVKFCFRGAMNVDIIRDALLKEKELTGEFPKLIVVDYLENVLTDLSNDPTIAKGFVARSLKDIANEFAICVILLTQPAKVTGGPAEELNSYFNIKGSGLVAEASAQVITMHRPGFDPKNPADDNFITLTVVKNRMGTLGTFDYHWEGVRGTIRELTQEEKQTLKVVRDQNFAKKKGMDDL